MSTIKKFEDLEIWQIAEKLSLKIFTESTIGEFYKDFRFKDQIRAASGSIMDNIAEGFERSSRLEFINFLGFAKGSCGEVKSQLHRAKDQQYITEDFFTELYESYDRLSANIAGFIGYLNRTSIKGQKFKDRN
ncbi:four helix bundle protein [Niabella soli]|uniref:30S ribosomal protein S23 n=1 Tax=Niabella soli DSM 19437 TaxID=929713 RepID=W0F0L6_9BACT|nr:four helix bundle protein [Niabella soli]AHF14876.1 30S ribosomal protein S23 [Niabella soli DSM 19437]